MSLPPSFRSVRAVVFDLDGTLLDAFDDIARAVNHMLAQIGREPLPTKHVMRYVGRGARELVSDIVGTTDAQELDHHYAVLTDFYQRNPVGTARLYPGAEELLRGLRQRGYGTALATNKPTGAMENIINHLDLHWALDVAVGETPGIPKKPAADMMNIIAERLNVTSEEILMVGDTDVDIQFGQQYGCATLGITHGQLTREELVEAGADVVIDDLRDLLNMLPAQAPVVLQKSDLH